MALPVLGIVALVGGFFSRTFLQYVAMFIAIKVVLITLIVVFLPTVLNNVFHDLIQEAMTFATSQVSTFDGNTPFVYQFTGMGAYLANCFRLPEIVSLTLSALGVRFALKVLRVY